MGYNQFRFRPVHGALRSSKIVLRGSVMKRSIRCLLSLCGVSAFCLAQSPAPNPAFREIKDVAGLPRVLLIGDSISIGYTEPVRMLLSGTANVHRIPTNGATTANGVENLDSWVGTKHWDVIHFNFGLHDLRYMDNGNRQI